MAYGAFSINKPELPDCAQDVVTQTPKGQDQGIGGEFARWEPFKVHIGFDLAVELLAGSTVLVEADRFLFGQIQGSPPPFHLDFGHDKTLAAPVNGALDCPHNPFEPVSLPIVDLLYIDREQPDSFSFPGSRDLAFFENPPRPFQPVFPSGVPFNDVADISFARQGNTGVQRIVGRVKAHKDFSGSKSLGFLDDPVKKRNEPVLAVLAAFTQLKFQTPSLLA